MKKIALYTLCSFVALTLTAQTPTFDWAINMGGTNFDKGNDIATDASGNVYVTGTLAGTADFAPGAGVVNLVSNGNDDIFIAKYSSTGNLLWAHNIGGADNETAVAMALDASGNCYVAGRFSGAVDFDPGAATSTITASGAFDVCIVKLSSSGNFVWAKNFGGTFGTFVNNISLDNAGNVYTTGTFQTTTDFDPSAAVFNLTSTGGQDPYLVKLDTAGNFVWAINSGFDISKMNIDHNNNIYLAGSFNATIDFDPDSTQTHNLTPIGGADIHITKFDTAANFVWVKTIGGASSESVTAINTDANGNIIVAGTFGGTVDFDPGAGTANLTAVGSGSTLSDMYFLKLDEAASFVWVKKVGGNSIDVPYDIGTDNSGNVYFAGRFNSATVDFNPDTTATFNLNGTFNSYEAFVLILSATGNFIYAYELGGPSNGNDEANGISVNPSGSIYVTGTFYGPIDFDPGAGTTTLDDNGNTDVFIQKMNFSPVGLADVTDENYFTIYPNPAANKFTVKGLKFDAVYELRIFDVLGSEVLKSNINSEQSEINVSGLKSGIYFAQIDPISIDKGLGRMSKKIIIQ
jgi:hypothetical protein